MGEKHRSISHAEAVELEEGFVKDYCEAMASTGFPIAIGSDMLQTEEDVERSLAGVRETIRNLIEYSSTIETDNDAME